jgi:lipopolysaccharide transport system ATP-binding protein
MSDIVIAAENLSKSYLVGHQSAERERYIALRDVIAREARNFVRKGLDFIRGRQVVQGDEVEEFWALRDMSFEVRQGEVLGIIGRNGAGKSTLLKILSRITEPTRGRVSIRGRVASLLEVGTGFHPELTGRENIYLNGAILGMTQREIRKKFDEIVAFSEVEQFLDTPVKRYSSGMYVRLAFSVAAHLDPDIFVVDEVLAVGDAAFQKKCLGKMSNVTTQQGRTVLFVSHNMAAVEALCHKCLYLDRGVVRIHDVTERTVAAYMADLAQAEHVEAQKSGIAEATVRIQSNGIYKNVFQVGEKLSFEIKLEVDRPIRNAAVGLGITSWTGQRVLTFHTHYQYRETFDINRGCACFVEWPELVLVPGTYGIVIALYSSNQLLAHWDHAGTLNVVASDYFGTGKLPEGSHQGNVIAHAVWKIHGNALPAETI